MNETDSYFFEYLDTLEKEVVSLLIHDKMFKETTEIIRNNPTLKQTNSFFSWMISAYISDITIRIRRLVDEDGKVKSFVNFLKDLKNDPSIRSREHHVQFFKDKYISEDIGNEGFDILAGKDASEFRIDLIQADIVDLKDKCKKTVVFTHNFIAHSSVNVIDQSGTIKIPIPTFTDLNVAISLLDTLLRKYFLLLKTSERGKSLMPDWPYNWKSIFEVPWITPTIPR